MPLHIIGTPHHRDSDIGAQDLQELPLSPLMTSPGQLVTSPGLPKSDIGMAPRAGTLPVARLPRVGTEGYLSP